MLQLSRFRLKERQTASGLFDFFDSETGRLVAVTDPEIVCLEAKEPDKRGPIGAIGDFLFRFRVFVWLFFAVWICGWLIGAILGFGRSQSKRPRPRLIVRRSDDGKVAFTLRKSSGLMYDSRRVYDGLGGLIAHFKSHFKTTIRGGFEIIDLRGLMDDGRDITHRPRFGRVVETSGRAYRFLLKGDREAGRIVRTQTSPGSYDIDAASELEGDATGKTLLLAAALAIAWWPPPES